MLTTIINRPCTLVLRDGTGTVDDDGEEVIQTTSVETVCELQQRSRSEDDQQGELSDTTWALYLLPGIINDAVDSGDAVVIDGAVYEVVGKPWAARNPLTQATSHIEATVRRTAGQADAS